MQRLAINHNLHHFDDSHFEGLPVMRGKGPFVTEHLAKLKRTLGAALGEHPRVLAFRVDLKLPDRDLPDWTATNLVIRRFFESFKAKIQHDRRRARLRNPRAHQTSVRYFWVREIGGKAPNDRQHYHVLVLLNRDAYYTLGRLVSENENLFHRLEEAWASALRLSLDEARGLVHRPKNATYRINRDEPEGLRELFYRATYMCKLGTKRFGNRHHSADASRG